MAKKEKHYKLTGTRVIAEWANWREIQDPVDKNWYYIRNCRMTFDHTIMSMIDRSKCLKHVLDIGSDTSKYTVDIKPHQTYLVQGKK